MVPAQEPCKHSSREHSLQAPSSRPPKLTFCPPGLIPLASSASQMLDCRLLGALWPFPGWCHGDGDHQLISPAHRWAGPTILHQQSSLINSWVSFPQIQPWPFLHSQVYAKAVKPHLHLLPSQSTASLQVFLLAGGNLFTRKPCGIVKELCSLKVAS